MIEVSYWPADNPQQMMTEEVATIDKLEPLLERLKQESALLASVMALHEAPRPA